MNALELRVVVIDDNPADAALIRRKLGEIPGLAGEIRVFTSAGEGKSAVLEGACDCVLLDYRLGEVNGLDLLAEIRGAGIDTPVIALTGEGNERVAVEALQNGAQDYLSKSALTLSALGRAIRNAVEKVALERKLAEKHHELEDFVSVVAHDLQQPLAAVRGNLDLIRDFYSERLDDNGRDFVRAACSTADRMSGMIDGLLEYSRLGRSGQPQQTVRLGGVVSAAVANLAQALRSSNAEVRVHPLPTVRGDPLALTQLFQNLIGNAVKYRGEAEPEVDVSAVERNGDWRISVRDNGPGIDDAQHRMIFLPFRRGPKHKKLAGHGIGLATCKKIVGRHGGRIWVESGPGEGAAFHFTLPAAS